MSETNLPTDALSQADLARLDELFELINPGEAMVMEELDGFYTALICSGDSAAPTEYLHDVLGIEDGKAIKYPSPADASEVQALLTRHWRSVQNSLAQGEVLAPLLTEDEVGINPGNLWALGFLRGIDLRPDPWEEIEEDTLNEWLEPIETLAEEIDFESGDKRLKLTTAEREQLLDEMFDTVFDAYQHFVAGDGDGELSLDDAIAQSPADSGKPPGHSSGNSSNNSSGAKPGGGPRGRKPPVRH